jgi:hypothetical protein
VRGAPHTDRLASYEIIAKRVTIGARLGELWDRAVSFAGGEIRNAQPNARGSRFGRCRNERL